MRVAYCFYGQTRDYKTGHVFVKKILERHPNIQFDFYFHTWKPDDGEKFEHSPWRRLTESELTPDRDIESNLVSMYNPKKYEIERPRRFDVSKYENTLMYKNTNRFDISVINNVLSQYHSRTRTRNLFNMTDIKYDFVITSRFDLKKDININLYEIDPAKIYTSNIHRPRALADDNFLIMPPHKYLQIFSSIDDVVDNEELYKMFKLYNENYCFIAECVLFSKLLLYNPDFENIIYSPQIIW